MFSQSSIGIIDDSFQIGPLHFPFLASRLLESSEQIVLGRRGRLDVDIFVYGFFCMDQCLSGGLADMGKRSGTKPRVPAFVDGGLLVFDVDSKKTNIDAPDEISVTSLFTNAPRSFLTNRGRDR